MRHFAKEIHIRSMLNGGFYFLVYTNSGRVLRSFRGHHFARLTRGWANSSFTCQPDALAPTQIFERLAPTQVFERRPAESQEAENREHSCPGERTPGWCQPWPPGDFPQCEFFARKDGCWQTWDAGATGRCRDTFGALEPHAASKRPRTHHVISPTHDE